MDGDPHDGDRFDARGVGNLLKPLMERGTARSWPSLIREATGQQLDSAAMARYWAPYLEWLREECRAPRHPPTERSP